ncbi:hypothetical protein CRG98_021658 [Punica granatum]|uniref:Uncharacterized protein n=1 Tax=Punica granatum TaxID=22663 RepID=A0A2I0JPW5_PUNGR|nr:hypothetical protein CRG98_021658 [Punica granatum]
MVSGDSFSRVFVTHPREGGYSQTARFGGAHAGPDESPHSDPYKDDPTTYEEGISNIDSSKWLEAMKYEMDSMSKSQVWDLIDPPEEPDHWTAVKNILKYLRRTKDMVLVYGGGELRLDRFTDSKLVVDYRKSISSYIFTCNGGALSWKSSKQETTTDSIIEAEYITASNAPKEIYERAKCCSLHIITSRALL